MKSFKYMGKYTNEEVLPQRVHPEGYVPYKEPENTKKLAIVINIIAIVITCFTSALYFLRTTSAGIGIDNAYLGFMGGCLLSLLTLVPHEFLHGISMEGDVKMYQNLKQGMLFVISTDDMSKGRFIFMSMLPNLVFGFIPFIIFILFPSLTILGSLGAFCIGAGAGDYMNVFNTFVQVPSNAKVYMSGIHSYWYE